MERYETATLELVTFDEDVITASESSNSTNATTERQFEKCTYDHSFEAWIVTYTDGSTERYSRDWLDDEHNYGRPDVCG